MTVLIVGLESDPPSRRMYEKVKARNVDAVYFDTTAMPSRTRVTYSNHHQPTVDSMYQDDPRARRIPLSEIRSVYRRWSKGISAPREEDPVLAEVVYWNIDSFVKSFMRSLSHCRWINSAEATDMHNYKPWQLQILHENGIRIPETRFTNDPDSVRSFYEERNGQVIFKPVRGWAHTEQLTPEKLTNEALEPLTRSPITLQERVEGTDLRIYVVDDAIYAMEIQAETLDFRETENAKRVPITLPDAVQRDCHTIKDLLGLTFTGIDCRRTPEGEYVFFEANPTPVFILDEDVTGYPISDHLTDLLIQGNSKG